MILKAFRHVADAAGRDGQECYFLPLASATVLQRSKVRGSAPAGALNLRPFLSGSHYFCSFCFSFYCQCKWPLALFPRRKCENC